MRQSPRLELNQRQEIALSAPGVCDDELQPFEDATFTLDLFHNGLWTAYPMVTILRPGHTTYFAVHFEGIYCAPWDFEERRENFLKEAFVGFLLGAEPTEVYVSIASDRYFELLLPHRVARRFLDFRQDWDPSVEPESNEATPDPLPAHG
jgi:hypothetical protein